MTANRGLLFAKALDWRIRLGLTLTVGWLLLGVSYISATIGWRNFGSLPAAELGSFLEGAFAPLAFLWLVVGYFLQQKELEQNTNALLAQAQEIQRSAEQAVIQSEKMAQSEIHARQTTFLQIVNTVYAQLGSITGLLFISSQGATGEGRVSPQEMSQLFSMLSAQDTETFSRRLVETHLQIADPDEKYALFYGTEVRARHSNNFLFSFERLMRRAQEVDPDDMIRDSILASAHGFVYRIAKPHQTNAPRELADHKITGRFIDF
ncbi:MAG: hypothetical protein O7E57_00645 [Gammaproteobacteria bacterium]|nr:hypothetical protein [Gammaproteobacteria bacterium]MCZ6855870.1 hypothetical protein [Gammaproteobacteria bacterium]